MGAPKPILMGTGEYVLPFAWHPIHIDTQVLRIGQVLLLAVPGEFTTMAGRRLRESVAETAGIEGSKVVVAGLSNTYTHYITTWEEYQKQRYEAASTITPRPILPRSPCASLELPMLANRPRNCNVLSYAQYVIINFPTVL